MEDLPTEKISRSNSGPLNLLKFSLYGIIRFTKYNRLVGFSGVNHSCQYQGDKFGRPTSFNGFRGNSPRNLP